MPYYGLYIPVKVAAGLPMNNNGASTTNSNDLVESATNGNNEISETDAPTFVFENKKEALQVLKQHKDARFKEFLNEEEAIKYAETGFEIVQNKCNDAKAPGESMEKAAFRAPTKQELIQFRKLIEHDDWKYVKQMIWDNPRYLVSSGDTPTILQEGFRYNALHVCAMRRSPNVAQVILNAISNPKFADLLMGKKNDEKSCVELCANLLDYYLNLAEKGRNETPLHIAAKFGHGDIVKILLSYPECKSLPNAQGQLARNIVCERKNQENALGVLQHFDERFYVPVLRSNDSGIPGQIGEPFSASNPPNLNCDLLTPEVEIKAVAGPMSEEQAKKFYRRWKTPPRVGSNVSSPIANNPFISPMKPHNSTPRDSHNIFKSPIASLRKRSLFNSTPNRYDQEGVTNSNGFDKSLLSDSFESKNNITNETNKVETKTTNNMDKLSKSQINMVKSSLCPRTPLFKLRSHAFSNYREYNIASPVVDSIELNKEVNDSLLNVSDIYDTPGYIERHVKNTDIDKGLECIGRVLAKEDHIEWREYWDFLEEFVDIASDSGIMKLENYLGNRLKEQDQCKKKSDGAQKADLLDDVCNALENAFRISCTSTDARTLNTSNTHQSSTPYTYVEKSLQVHARRMTKTIIHNIDNEMSIIDALLLELRRVKSLIYSFKEDTSYINVNFEKVHSRVGNLVAMFLENSQEVSKQAKWTILVILQNISSQQGERSEHLECVCARIVEMLHHPIEQILPENVKTEEICSKIWSEEKDCDCQWENNLRRKTSRHNRMAAFNYRNQQRWKEQEKLQADQYNKQEVNNMEDYRSTRDKEHESSEEEEFWSDVASTDSDEDEVFLTPCESLSCLSLSDYADDYTNRIFIYGNEPTKRDLDVLNAIFHINIDVNKYPNIHSWKCTLMRYTNDEMDFFPSPRTVKKSHSFMATSSNKKDYFVHPEIVTSKQKTYSILRSNTCATNLSSSKPESSLVTTASAVSLLSSNIGIIKAPILQLPKSKRVFMSPVRTKSMTAISNVNNTNSKNTSNATVTKIASSVTEEAKIGAQLKIPLQQKLQTQRPLTPLNKLRGLFSAYRECVDNSPLANSPSSSDSSNWLQ